MNTATNQGAGADASADGVADAQGDGEILDLQTENGLDPDADDADDDEPQGSDDDGDADPDNDDGEGAEETEEITFEGKTARVPKVFKEAFLRHADYTQKTQELAEQRRAVDQERGQLREQLGRITQRNDEVINLRADLTLIDREIKRISEMDLPALYQEDPAQAQAEQFRLGDLREKRARLVGTLTQREQASVAEAKQAEARQVQETQSILARDIPGWNAEMVSKVASYAAKEFGVSREEMVALDQDPRLAKLLHRAMTAEEALRKQTAVQRKAAGQTTTPAPSLKGGKGRNSVSPTTDDFSQFEKFAKARLKEGA